jgi:hypothetical protein
VLPAPFNRTMPLLEPDGQSRGIPVPLIATCYIPEGIHRQRTLSNWEWEHGFVSNADYPSDVAALTKLPVLKYSEQSCHAATSPSMAQRSCWTWRSAMSANHASERPHPQGGVLMAARTIAISTLLAAGLAAAGCTSTARTTSPPASAAGSTAVVSTAPSIASSPPTSAPTPSATSSAQMSAPASGTSNSTDEVAWYEPSFVVSQAAHTLLRTSDDVEKVTNFYDQHLTNGGWTIISKTSSPYSGNFTVRKSGHGATVAISSTGNGSSVSISTY